MGRRKEAQPSVEGGGQLVGSLIGQPFNGMIVPIISPSIEGLVL